MKFGISLLFVLTTWNLFAKVTLKDINSLGLVYFQEAELESGAYSIVVSNSKGNQVTQIYLDDKIIFEQKVSPITDAFKQIRLRYFAKSETPYAIIKYQKGVHGEQVKVVSLKDGKVAYHETSVWPLMLDFSDDELTINIVDEDKKTTTKKWKP